MPLSSVLVSLVCFLLVFSFYFLFQHKSCHSKALPLPPVFFKGMATLCAALLAVYGAVLRPDAGNMLLLFGLIVCAVADVVIHKNLMRGMGIFAVGHVYYCGAYFFTAKPSLFSLILFIFLLLFACFFLYPQIKKRAGDKPALPFLGYGAMLFLMLSLSVNQKPVLMMGAILFVVSDLMLAFRIFTQNKSRAFDCLCLGCYYLAQYLIALSTLL